MVLQENCLGEFIVEQREPHDGERGEDDVVKLVDEPLVEE
jgi:hypothetical protein